MTTDLEGNPHDVDDNVKALLLATVVLERPHAVFLAVPVGAGGAVHSAAADLGEAGGWFLGGIAIGGTREGRGVLDDGAVDGVLERRLVVGAGARLADQRLEDGVLFAKITRLLRPATLSAASGCGCWSFLWALVVVW